MQKEILSVLLDNDGKFISGEELSERLNVSRTAVWKHIKSLKEAGYTIEAKPHQGYRLVDSPDILLENELTLTLATKWLGQELQIYRELPSTNDLGKKIADEGVAEGTVIVAEEQTKGRGRMGRLWESPAQKGLWFSAILRPNLKPHLASQLIFVAAVGTCLALRNMTNADILIKWPNDLLIKGKKICGILAEMSAEIDQLNHIVLGIGLNVNQSKDDFSAEIAEHATSLSLATGKKYRRVEILAEILCCLEETYEEYREKGFKATIDSWKAMNCTLGRAVKVVTREETFLGIAEDLASDGSLLVRKEDGKLEKIIVGDVSLR